MMSRTITTVLIAAAAVSQARAYQNVPPAVVAPPAVSAPPVVAAPTAPTIYAEGINPTVVEGVPVATDTGSGEGGLLGFDFNPLGQYPARWKARSELVYWLMQGSNMPALVTTSPPGTPQNLAGVLGQPGTTILAGGRSDVEDDAGVRFRLLYWMDCFESEGVEFIFAGLSGSGNLFSATSDGTPILARPFFDADAQMQASQLIAFPGLVTGSIAIDRETDLASFELNGRQNLSLQDRSRTDFIFGTRYIYFSDDLLINESLNPGGAGTAFANGTNIRVQDSYDTDNHIFLAQIGLEHVLRRGPFAVEFFGKVGLGASYQYFQIRGQSAISAPGAEPVFYSYGFSTTSNNIDARSQQIKFAAVPELGVNLRLQVTPSLSTHVGYSFMYMFPALRPQDAMDGSSLSPVRLLPSDVFGPAKATESYGSSDAWLMGLSAGVEFRY